MNEEINVTEKEISLVDLFTILLQKWWIIGVVTGLFMVASWFYAYTQLEDEYTATSSMIIQELNFDNPDYQQIQIGKNLVDTYNEIALSNRVLEQLIVQYELDYTPEQLRDMITITANNDTVVLQVEVESYVPEDAAEIANGLIVVLRDVTLLYDGLETVDQLDVAKVPTDPSGPNRILYILIGTVLGGGVSSVFVLMSEFLDKKLKRPQEIESVLGIRLLGTIPFYDNEEEVM